MTIPDSDWRGLIDAEEKERRIRDAERAAVEAAERAYDECHCYDEWTCEACKAMGVAIRALQEARK